MLGINAPRLQYLPSTLALAMQTPFSGSDRTLLAATSAASTDGAIWALVHYLAHPYSSHQDSTSVNNTTGIGPGS